MTSSIRILTTSTLDSSPAVVLTSPDGSSILINCGEGCQRSFLESSSKYTCNLRIRSVDTICLTHFGYDSIGGLPGFILTSADVAAVASAHTETMPRKKRKTHDNGTAGGGLHLYGPSGTARFIHSLRHFMKREQYPLGIHEASDENGTSNEDTVQASSSFSSHRHKDQINITLISCSHASHPRTPMQDSPSQDTSTCSYIFKTPPIPGKFILEKAKKLGIPPGPLYAQLKAGQSISFVDDKTKQQITVTPDQVLDPGNEGKYVAFFHVPDLHTLQQLQQHHLLQRYYDPSSTHTQFQVMIHHTPQPLFYSSTYLNWIRSFGPQVDHITLFPMQNYIGGHEAIDGSPFRSAILGAITRNVLCPRIFPHPLPSMEWNNLDKTLPSLPKIHNVRITMAHSMMEYILIPLVKSGFVFDLESHDMHPNMTSSLDMENILSIIHSTGASQDAKLAMESMDPETIPSDPSPGASLLFLGTGSALPCKHRNVSGIYLQMRTGHAIVLDVGEGSVGQLLRSCIQTAKDPNHFSHHVHKLLQSIQAVWISHPHADHHLGILHLLTARNASFVQTKHGKMDPLILMAPPCIFQFLTEYESIDPSISGGYIPLPSSQMTHGLENPMSLEINHRLGITSCLSVPVDHCQHSFAIILDGTSFGRVVYSGDCRPSNRLAQVAKGADLLIHEATFEDGMESEAVLKRHSTVGEAIRVAEQMDAKFLLLTHFSQRYPKIPPIPVLDTESSSTLSHLPVAFAFDYMRITPHNLLLASKIVPSLRKLYVDDKTGNSGNEEDKLLSQVELMEGGLSAKEVLDVPGAFIPMDCFN